MNIYNPLPIYNGEGFGFLSPLFEAPINVSENWYPSIKKYCEETKEPISKGYFHLFLQYPKYKNMVKKLGLNLYLRVVPMNLQEILVKVSVHQSETRMKNTNFRQNLEQWIKIVKKACAVECIKGPTQEMIEEILYQNSLKKHEKYLAYI